MLQVLKIFKVFGAQSYLMVVYQFDQGNYVCEEYNNFQNLKSIFMIINFPNMAFETVECWCIVGLTAILRFTKEKLHFSLTCSFIVAS